MLRAVKLTATSDGGESTKTDASLLAATSPPLSVALMKNVIRPLAVGKSFGLTSSRGMVCSIVFHGRSVLAEGGSVQSQLSAMTTRVSPPVDTQSSVLVDEVLLAPTKHMV